MSAFGGTGPVRRPERVVIVDWTHLIEDYLGAIGLRFAEFRDEMSGGWMFGYVSALANAGIRPLLYVFSARTRRPTVHRHGPTGTPIRVLPAPAAYRALRRVLWDPYTTERAAAGPTDGWRSAAVSIAHALSGYAATPLATVAAALERDEVDAVICQDYEHPRFDLLVALGRLLRIPVFATFQGGDFRLSRAETVTRRIAVRAADGLLVASSAEIERLRDRYRVPANRIHRVPNPLDTSPWRAADRTAARHALGIAPSTRVVVWHGRVMLHLKGLDLLLDAWDRLLADGPCAEVLLLLVGDGPDADHLETALVGTQKVRWRRGFLNDRDELARHVAAGDVAVLPSRHEGFPVAPMEAMAAGVPVVLSDLPSTRDLAPRGAADGGVLVPARDPATLARTLRRLVDDVDLSRRLGERAQRHAERAFSLEAVGARLAEILSGEAAQQPPRPGLSRPPTRSARRGGAGGR